MNAYTSVVRSYQQQAVNTGSPLRLVVFLYDGAIRFFRLSARAFAEGEREKAREYLLRAEKIVLELLGSLNFEAGGEIARNLSELYCFIVGRCGELSEENYAQIIEENCRLLGGLREAWVQLEQKANGEQ
jgi:flagellar protein FliS